MSSNFAQRRAKAKAEKAGKLRMSAPRPVPVPTLLPRERGDSAGAIKKQVIVKKPIIHRLSDEDAEEWVLSGISDVLHWRTPLLSGLWCSTISLIFILTTWSEYSFVTLVCDVMLLQLATTWILIRIGPTLAQMGLVRPTFDGKTFTLQRRAFTDQDLKNASIGISVILSKWGSYWYDALTTNDARKVLSSSIFMFTIAIIGKAMPLQLFLFLVFVLCFSLPPLYDQQQEQIDEFLYDFHDRFDPIIEAITDRLQAVLPDYDDNYYY